MPMPDARAEEQHRDAARHVGKVRTLVATWLLLDFFGDSRRSGGGGSTLTTTIFTQSFLALVFAALLYPETPVVPFAAANLSLSSLLIAVGLLGHDRASRRRADEVLLATAPIGRAGVVLARSCHTAFYACLTTLGMALPPAVLLAFLQRSWWSCPAYLALACLCTGLASGVLGVFVQFMTRLFGDARANLIAGSAKAILLGAGLVLFANGLRRLSGTAESLPIGRLGAELLPPYQAARVLADPVGDGWRVLPLLGFGALLFVLAVAAAGVQTPRRNRLRENTPLRALLRLLAGRGPTLAVAEFVAISMWRSAGFRSRVLPLLGLPAGMVFLGLQAGEQRHGFTFTCLLLQLPAVYLPFLIAFLPRADHGGAEWIFEQAPDLGRNVVHDASWRALVSHVLLPIHTFSLVLLLATAPRVDVVAASMFALGIAVIASRWMITALPTVPFTQERESETALDLGTLMVSALVLCGLGSAFAALLPPAGRWVAAAAAIGGAVMLLRRRPGRSGAPIVGLTNPPAHAGEPGGGPESGHAQPEVSQRDQARGRRPEASLRRELQAVGVLYMAVCVLPALIGMVFAG